MSIGAHMPDVLDRVMVTDQCWIWLGSRSTKGYGQISRGGRHLQVHRIAFESEFGDIPAGLVIDHLCHDPAVCVGGTCVHRLCVRPSHLAAVTNEVNLARQTPASKTHCAHNHPLSGDNLGRGKKGRRYCRTCAAANARRYAANPNAEAPLIRAWAREAGLPVGDRGRIRSDILTAYRESQQVAA